jgi:hypothetical protein
LVNQSTFDTFSILNTDAAPAPSGYKPQIQFFSGKNRAGAKKAGKQPRNAPAFKPLPSPAPRRLVVVDSGISLTDELFILASLELLKKQDRFAKTNLTYVSFRADVVRLVKGAWFLKETYLCTDPKISDDLEGEGAHWLTVPTAEQALATEQQIFAQLHTLRMKQYEQMVAQLGAQGISAPNLEEPNGTFEPNWHRSQAIFAQVANTLGIQYSMPDREFAPYATLPKNREGFYRNILEKSGIGQDLFLLHHFPESETSGEACVEQLGITFPGAGLISASAILDKAALYFRDDPEATSHGLSLLIAALAHRNCFMAIGPAGDLTNLAWGAGQLSVLSVYRGDDPRWDGVYSPNPFMLNAKKFNDEELPKALHQAAVNLIQKVVSVVQ